MTTMRAGLCCGGPLDGKMLAFSGSRFQFFTRDASRGLRKECLGHYEFLAGFWIWKPAATTERPNA